MGALDLLNNAIRPLIDAMTQAGQMRRALDQMNGSGESTTVSRQIAALKGSNHKQARYNAAISNYDKQIADRQAAVDAWNRWRNGERSASLQSAVNRARDTYGTNTSTINAEIKALQKMKSEYQSLAKDVLNPQKPAAATPPVAGGGVTTRGGGGGHIPKVTPVEEVAPEGSMKALQKEMNDLRKEQDLVTDPAGWQEIQKQIDDVTERMNALKGVTKNVDDELAKLEAPIEINVEANADTRSEFEKLQDSIRIRISDHNVEVDQTTLQTLMQVAMQNGIEGLDLDFSSVLQQMVEGADIPPEAWESLKEKINDQLKSMGIEPITLDVETGNIVKTGAQAEKSWHAAAGAISSVSNALQQVEDPAAKIIGIIGQAIANVALGFAQASASPATTSAGVFGWIAAAVAGTATMLSTIASIKSATAGNYAEGGIVPGSSYSGDNIRAFGLNSGEVILNRAQSDSIADQLTSSPMGDLQLSTVIDAEEIRFILNNRGRRTGRGEYVQSRFRR